MTAVYTHYLCHALLFQCRVQRIFEGEYKRLTSLLTIRRLIVSKQMRRKSLN